MIIDSFSGVPPPQALDIKPEKNNKAEEPRAIEELSKSDDSKLDKERQNISKKPTAKDIRKYDDIELTTYNAKDNSEKEIPPEYVTDQEQGPIDIIV